jgi:hypothetical protein
MRQLARVVRSIPAEPAVGVPPIPELVLQAVASPIPAGLVEQHVPADGAQWERPAVAARAAAQILVAVLAAADTAAGMMGAAAGRDAGSPARTERGAGVDGTHDMSRYLPIAVPPQPLWAEVPGKTAATMAAGLGAGGGGLHRPLTVDPETGVGYRRDRDTKPPAYATARPSRLVTQFFRSRMVACIVIQATSADEAIHVLHNAI